MSSTTAYYDATAQSYDDLHGAQREPEHSASIEKSWPVLSRLGIKSALDVGCGTGNSLARLRDFDPSLMLAGIDLSEGLLDIARKRLPEASISFGNAEDIQHPDGSFDLVLATGIMHHVDHPTRAISELFRVARVAVIISDHNNFAFGGDRAKRVRSLLNTVGLLPLATFVKQGFKKKGYSDDDGWWYPFSLLDQHPLISSLSKDLYWIPTRRAQGADNFLYSQSHMAALAIKEST